MRFSLSVRVIICVMTYLVLLVVAVTSGEPSKEIRYIEAYETGQVRGHDTFSRWLRAMILLERGEARAAVKMAGSARRAGVCLREVKGEALVLLGHSQKGEGLLDRVLDDYSLGRAGKDQWELICILRAALMRGRWRWAAEAYRDLSGDDSVPALVESGRYLLRKGDPNGAMKFFETVLSKRPLFPPAACGKATIMVRAMGSSLPKAVRLLDRGQKKYPWYPGWYAARVSLALVDEPGQFDRAMAALSGVAPRHPHIYVYNAAWAYIHGKSKEAAIYLEKQRKVCPGCRDTFLVLSHLAELHHRYGLAARLARKGMQKFPNDTRYLYEYGRMLLFRGDVGQAGYYLAETVKIDPYHAGAVNIYNLLQKIRSDYTVEKSGPFEVYVPRSRRVFARTLLIPVLRRAYERYSSLYGVSPSPVRVFAFADVPQFSVALSGEPMEWTGVRGVCFGNVIFTTVPYRGMGNWAMIVTHELAHTFQIAITEGDMPRWFAEGLAEYETLAQSYYWHRPQVRDAAALWDDGLIPPVTRLDQAFSRARSGAWMVGAYKYSTLVVRYIHLRWGYRGLVGLLRAFGRHMDTAGAMKSVLGVKPEQFERGLARYVRALWGPYLRQLLFERLALWTRDDLDTLVKRGRTGEAAALAAAAGLKDKAKRLLARTAARDPWGLVARSYLLRDRRSIALLKQANDIRPDAMLSLKLAAYSEGLSQKVMYLRQAVRLDPHMGAAVWRLMHLVNQREEIRRLGYHLLDGGMDASVAEKVLDVARERGIATLEITALYLALQSTPGQYAARASDVAVALARAGACPEALSLFGYSDASGFPDPAGKRRLWKAVCLIRTGDVSNGCRSLEQVLRSLPGLIQARSLYESHCRQK